MVICFCSCNYDSNYDNDNDYDNDFAYCLLPIAYCLINIQDFRPYILIAHSR